jgi:hypothetical protein
LAFSSWFLALALLALALSARAHCALQVLFGAFFHGKPFVK